MVWQLTVYLVLLPCVFHIVQGSPPGEPVRCSDTTGLTNCTVSNAYGMFPDRIPCRAASALFPSNEQEVMQAVAMATRRKQKMKVVTRWSQSIPKLVCPGGDSGLIISTLHLNRIVAVNTQSMTITVEGGVTLRELIDAAAERGLALPQSPYWDGVTIAGLLATGAHGSSLFANSSAVHEYVVALKLISPASHEENYVRITALTREDKDLNAALVSLGLLGIISQVTLQLQPMFKRSIIYLLEGDASLEDNILHFGRNHEFGDVTWYPSQRKVLYRIDDRVSMNVSGDGVNDFIGFRPIPTMLLATARMSEEVQEASQNRMGKCACAEAETMAMVRGGFGLHNRDGEGYGYPVVGFQNMMQASGSCLNSPNDALLTACAWDPRVKGLFFHQTAVAIELSKISEFIKDVKRLGDLRPGSLCGLELYNGILMRFVKGSAGSAYLGAEHDSVAVDMTYYRAREGESPRLDEDVLEEIEQMALFKYGGTPHWGKNRNIAFHGVMEKYSESKYGEFIKAKHKYDPEGLFSNDWTDALLQIGNSSVVLDKDACALEGLCLCREDRHCAPDKGYFCRPGIVFADARVCRYIGPQT